MRRGVRRSKRERILTERLRYEQTMNRIAADDLRLGYAKCKAIAAELREIQQKRRQS